LTHPRVEAIINAMANWLYAKVGEIAHPVERAPLRLSELETPANAFEANIDRIRAFWALNPMLIHKSCQAVRVACEAAFAIAGHFPLTRQDALDPLIAQKIEQKAKELAAKAPLDKDELRTAVENFDSMIKDSDTPAIDDAIYATLCSQLTSGWTAFETLVGDLWEAALNVYPSTLAGLNGSRTRIQKIAGKRPAVEDQDAGEPKEVGFNLKAFHRLTKGTFNAERIMGSLLKENRRFDKLSGIREAYSLAFSKRHTEIDNLLIGDALDKLNLVRNVILHKAGIVDQKFLDGAKAIHWNSGAQLNNALTLDGQIVKDLLSPVFTKGWELVYAVDQWITTAKDSKED
jgi:hypothetical protein